MAVTTDASLVPMLKINWDHLPRIGIGWEINLQHGWGIHGYHLAKRIIERGAACPMAVGGLRDRVKANAVMPYPLNIAELEAWKITPDFPLVRGGGNCPTFVPYRQGDMLIQVFENTGLTSNDIAALRQFGHRLITVSEWNAEFLRDKGVDATCCHLGVDTEMFQPRARGARFGEDRFVVFSGGKLELRKGQDIVLAAFKIFQQRHAEAMLVTMWHNHWPDTAKSIEASPYWDGHITEDIGLVDRATLAGLMSSFDVALFPNRCEGGTNMVVMECLAAGVPTILSRGHGHSDLINHPVPCFALDYASRCEFAEANERWIEPALDEVVAALEYVYEHRTEARTTGLNAAMTMQGYWTWDNRMDAQIAALRIGKDDSGLDAAMAATKSTLEKRAAHTLSEETAKEYARLAGQMRNAGHHKTAVAVAKRAMRIAPQQAEVIAHLGNMLLTDHQPHASLEHSKTALRLSPSLANVCAINMGLAHLYNGQNEAALREFDKADASMVDVAFNRSHALLALGRWREGLAAMEVRRTHVPDEFPKHSMPEWNGEPVDTLWVTTEQGIGDAFMFARFLPWARTRCRRLIFSAHGQTIPLFTRYPGIDEVQLFDPLMPEPQADAHIPLMSLAKLYGATPDTIPPDPGHFTRLAKCINADLSAPPGVRKVGIVWAGSAIHLRDWERSLPLEAFLPLVESPHIQLFSLQVGKRVHDLDAMGIKDLIPDLSAKLTGWTVTAAVLRSLDALVTCDTAIAHLAGALGVKTYLMLCKFSDWRWLLKREDTPWYPSVRLVRQKQLGKWDAPMTLIASKLDKPMPEAPL